MKPRRLGTAVLVLSMAVGLGARADELRDLHFAEALYLANQDYYFDALERLDAELAQHHGLDEPQLDSLHYHIGQAEFSVGDFELSYRMHRRAGRAIRAVLEGDVPPEVRNEAAYRLARIHFQKGQMMDALAALDRLDGRLPPGLSDDVRFLQANVYLAIGRTSAAVELLRNLQGSDALRGFADYNLGIALLNDGQLRGGRQQLDRAGQIDASTTATHAIRDKANLTLGSMLLEDEAFVDAQATLARVRLEGPFSNQALLSAGWADVSSNNMQRALVPWGLLVDREPTDAAVQEAMLALPYAYGQLGVHGRAAVLYGRALDTFGRELDKLSASIRSIRDGRFLEALVREEIHQDKDWVVRLRALPETPETFYLLELMASHDFQTALQNYLDLEELRRKLLTWERNFAAYDDIIEARRSYYEPLLPGIDNEFRQLDSRIRLRLQQHELLAKRLEQMLVMPRPDFLATTEERLQSAALQSLSTRLDAEPGDEELRQRIARLQGVITWMLRTEYDTRLNGFHDHLLELQTSVDALNAQYHAYVRVRQAAAHSYMGYDQPIGHLRTRVRDAHARVEQLMARQGRALETVAIEELELRKTRLEDYRNQARYAIADSYDRATQAQGVQQP